MTDIPDAAMRAAVEAALANFHGPMNESPAESMEHALRAALPHLVPRDLLMEAMEAVQYRAVALRNDGHHESANAMLALALRLRQAAGE